MKIFKVKLSIDGEPEYPPKCVHCGHGRDSHYLSMAACGPGGNPDVWPGGYGLIENGYIIVHNEYSTFKTMQSVMNYKMGKLLHVSAIW